MFEFQQLFEDVTLLALKHYHILQTTCPQYMWQHYETSCYYGKCHDWETS